MIEHGHEKPTICTPGANISLQGRGVRSSYISGEGLTAVSFPTTQLEEAYVRVIVRDVSGNRAWSNPIWFD